MEWLTREDAKKAGNGTELDAVRCSLLHWEQMRDASFEEFSREMPSIGSYICAVCIYNNKMHNHISCTHCCLPICGENNSCWTAAHKTINNFKRHQCRETLAKFQDAADDMCEVIKTAIERLGYESKLPSTSGKADEDKKQTLEHGDYGLWTFPGIGENEPAIYINNYAVEDTAFSLDGSYCSNASSGEDGRRLTKLGNIFKDIKRNKVDLEHFVKRDSNGTSEVKLHSSKCCNDITIMVSHASMIGVSIFSLGGATELHQKLGQIIASARRKARNDKNK